MILLVFLLIFIADANAQCRSNDRTVSCRDYKDFRGMETVIIGRLRGAIDVTELAIQQFVVLHSEVGARKFYETTTPCCRSTEGHAR